MKELLEIYYKGFAEKANWESVMADDFAFVTNDAAPLKGKLQSLTIYFDASTFQQNT